MALKFKKTQSDFSCLKVGSRTCVYLSPKSPEKGWSRNSAEKGKNGTLKIISKGKGISKSELKFQGKKKLINFTT